MVRLQLPGRFFATEDKMMRISSNSARPRLEPMGEAALIAAAQGGDRAAFDRLAGNFLEPIRRFVKRRVGEDRVDDVVQETLLAAWTHLDRYGKRSAFKTWVLSIALNKCRDCHRARKENSLEVEPEVGAREFDRAEMRADVRRALGELSMEHRELLTMYYEEEMTLREIATVLETNLNTVKYRFYRAHEAFAAQLGEFHA